MLGIWLIKGIGGGSKPKFTTLFHFIGFFILFHMLFSELKNSKYFLRYGSWKFAKIGDRNALA